MDGYLLFLRRRLADWLYRVDWQLFLVLLLAVIVGFLHHEVLEKDDRCEQIEGLFGRGFAVEVENRFQSCEECLGRLVVALKPATPDEDPANVSAALTKLLRLHDRTTLLHEYGQVAQKVLQRMIPQAHKAFQGIAAPFTSSIAGGHPDVWWRAAQAVLDLVVGVGQLDCGFRSHGGIPPPRDCVARRFCAY
jgi:hypothetical protein